MTISLNNLADLAVRRPAGGLAPTDRPLALLPVRLETRFQDNALLIRIYPDDIHIDRLAARSDSEGHAPVRLLPDRFIALGFRRGARVLHAQGAPVASDLVVGNVAAGPDEATEHTALWMVDFERAVAQGMALRVPLDDETARVGVDTLLVLGAKSALGADAGATELQRLLDAHRETSGLAFVPQGTPTNPTAAEPDPKRLPVSVVDVATEVVAPVTRSRSGVSARLGAPLADLAVRRPRVPTDTNGAVMSRALGLDAGAWNGVEHASDREQARGRAMNTVLWPATWGYTLAQMTQQLLTRSPLVSSDRIDRIRRHFIDHVRARGPLPAVRVGRQPYGFLPVTSLAAWKSAGPADLDEPLVDLLRKGRPLWSKMAGEIPRVGRDPGDRLLVETLRMRASSQGVDARPVMGAHYAQNLLWFLRDPSTSALHTRWFRVQEDLGRASLEALGLGDERPRLRGALVGPDAVPLTAPLVAETPSKLPLSDNYLKRARTEGVADLRARQPGTVLDLLVRHGTLLEYANAATHVHGRVWSEPELIDMEQQPTETLWTLLDQPAPPTGGASVATWLRQVALSPQPPEVAKNLRELLLALDLIDGAATNELHRLAGETIDLASHRLDAWITSLAARRMRNLRKTQPKGVYIGAYGWVTELRPSTDARKSDGHLLAPSVDHAATAALLRSGHLAHGGAGPLAIDLSSARARTARYIIGGINRGQPLGALLGYRFERALEREGQHQHIAFFRGVAPSAPDSIEANDVVDGYALLKRWRAGESASWGDVADEPGVKRALDGLEDAADAVADLLLAESVHRLAGGHPLEAAASLDALGRGAAPPADFDVLRTPRAMQTSTHRLMMLWPAEAQGDDPVASGWPSTGSRSASLAAPILDRWAASVLGPAASAHGVAELRDEDGVIVEERAFTLRDVALCALEIVQHAAANSDDPELGPGPWIVRQLRSRFGHAGPLTLRLGRQPDDPADRRSIADVLELAASVGALLSEVRPSTIEDMTDPARPAPTLDTSELISRAESLKTQMTELLDRLALGVASSATFDPEAMAGALYELAPLGFVPFELTGTVDDQSRQVRQAMGAVELRLAADDPSGEPGGRLAALISLPFRPLPLVLGSGLAFEPATPQIESWFRKAAHVRRGAGHLRDVALLARVLGTRPSLALHAAEVGASTSVVAHVPAGLGDGGALAGIVLDEWVEAVPSAEADCGLAFHFDAPAQEPPQCILLAVAPDKRTHWDVNGLSEVLLETLELARLRMVDNEVLDTIGQLLPAITLAFNTAGDAVSSDPEPLQRT